MTECTEASLADALAADPAALVARLNAVEAELSALKEQNIRLLERLSSGPESPTARIRPTATNEWDRMSTEIQDRILAHAGALTQFVNNRISNIGWWKSKQVVSDAFELDWQGDLRILPFEKFKDSFPGEPFWLLHTRSMYVRVKVLGFDFLKSGLDQAATLNWWTDLLDFKTPKHLTHMAARCGSIVILKYLVDERGIATLNAEHARLAVCFGHLEMLKWLAKRMPNGTWTAEVIDCAAYNNRLDCVKWLHANRNEGCTTDAMDLAAEWGHLGVVEFLHNNRTEGCTSKAMLKAAENGRADVVEFLHKNRTDGVIADAAEAAAQHGRLAVIKCIHALAPEVITAAIMRKAIEGGHIDVLEWMLDNTEVRLTSDDITCTVERGQLHMLSFIRKRVPSMLRAHNVSKIGAQQADGAIEWLCSPDVQRTPKPADVMRLATRLNKATVMRWLLWHLPDTKWHDGVCVC
ncbi:hypothetical protein HK105_209470 [Polyrhizophydium stewartii]|uniref:Ankyrin repeat protein n=1 Tax=Polyrhizophydium stewartii TaxID=2732419 RepID=A0ABR4MUY6_9FUNG